MRLVGTVFALAFACAGCELAHNYTDPHGPRYAADYAAEEQAPSRLPELTSVTFNVKFGQEYERAASEMTGSPALSRADVLLLQEMDAEGSDFIAAQLGLNYVYYPGSVQHGRDFGNAVLSRWPIVSDEKIILPHKNPTDGRQRIAVCAVLATPLGDARACSVHTETPWLGPRARLDQARMVRDHVAGAAEVTVVAGDFNTGDPGALEDTVRLYADGGFRWGSREVGDGLGTLDITFVRELEPLDSGEVATGASDHRPQWVDSDWLSPR